jgi:adenylyltransferase/sulfurtransferase
MNSKIKDLRRRHSRSIEVIGEKRQKQLAKSKIVIGGVGAVGTPFLEIMVRQGIGTIIVIDPDREVEEHNLDRQFLFKESSIGKPKALSAKEESLKINSNVEIFPYIGTFSKAIYSSLKDDIATADLVFSGIDNGIGRYSVAKHAFIQNIPHLDGATGGFNCRAYVFPFPREGPCLLCTFSKKDYEEISKSYSCTRRNGNILIGGAITETSVMVADILAMEALKLLVGIPTYYNEIRVNLENYEIMAERVAPMQNHRFFHVM